MFILKAVNLQYKENDLRFETLILVTLCIVETIRINLGRRGSLSDHGNFSSQIFDMLAIFH